MSPVVAPLNNRSRRSSDITQSSWFHLNQVAEAEGYEP